MSLLSFRDAKGKCRGGCGEAVDHAALPNGVCLKCCVRLTPESSPKILHLALDPRNECGACGKVQDEADMHAFNVGQAYCSQDCYRTLFAACAKCRKVTMSAKTNDEGLCTDCYGTKYGLHLVELRRAGEVKPRG